MSNIKALSSESLIQSLTAYRSALIETERSMDKLTKVQNSIHAQSAPSQTVPSTSETAAESPTHVVTLNDWKKTISDSQTSAARLDQGFRDLHSALLHICPKTPPPTPTSPTAQLTRLDQLLESRPRISQTDPTARLTFDSNIRGYARSRGCSEETCKRLSGFYTKSWGARGTKGEGEEAGGGVEYDEAMSDARAICWALGLSEAESMDRLRMDLKQVLEVCQSAIKALSPVSKISDATAYTPSTSFDTRNTDQVTSTTHQPNDLCILNPVTLLDELTIYPDSLRSKLNRVNHLSFEFLDQYQNA